MPISNSQVHREMLQRNVPGANAGTPLGQLEKVFYTAQSGITGNALRTDELGTLRKIIVTNGGFPNSNFRSDLYKQANAAKGLPVKRSMQENKRILELSL